MSLVAAVFVIYETEITETDALLQNTSHFMTRFRIFLFLQTQHKVFVSLFLRWNLDVSPGWSAVA